MMRLRLRALVVCLALFCHPVGQVWGQNKVFPFQDAAKFGISVENLDSVYRSAIHVDTTLAVFKTEEQQKAMGNAYRQLLQDFGDYLDSNSFHWTRQTRCFNRIYFNSTGSIDYYLYNFTGTAESKPSTAEQQEFQRLLSLFIADYHIPISASTRFAQCGPVTYFPPAMGGK